MRSLWTQLFIGKVVRGGHKKMKNIFKDPYSPHWVALSRATNVSCHCPVSLLICLSALIQMSVTPHSVGVVCVISWLVVAPPLWLVCTEVSEGIQRQKEKTWPPSENFSIDLCLTELPIGSSHWAQHVQNLQLSSQTCICAQGEGGLICAI